MPNPNNFLIDFLPAELHEAPAGWYISYYVAHPGTRKLTRKVIRWNRIANVQDRRRTGKQLCQKINLKLAQGWNPYIEQEAPKSYTPVTDALRQFVAQAQKQVKDGAIRPDTLRSYTSYINVLGRWWAANKKAEPYTYAITQTAIREFLDWIYYGQDNTPRTHNNYLTFIHNLGNWLVENQYCKANPATGITKKREGDKKRQIIPQKTLSAIWQHTQAQPAWHCLLKTIYFTFIRRTELAALRVEMVNLTNQTIFVPASISKNRKDNSVTLPGELAKLLAVHLKTAAKTWYLFGADNFTPGPEPCTPKKISDTWAKLRTQLKLPTAYQFYSLKDTGITAMLADGLPTIVVRDQARHHDISITNKYTPQGGNVGNELIKNIVSKNNK